LEKTDRKGKAIFKFGFRGRVDNK
jgi:hypothetical protein